ncbi:hypothetical protein ACD591_01045 [Rufibacter glacialis]|uniref:STAS/SEC14 domain-containing protein n=1 Tax=Rufibacter glacialis TaxID=1259555 RepID=A0A5M8QHD1_9BACT|nr:hypothetical protein [Rufibacter glacialis]KAA6435487.1 hypothetical protein FOE74_05955 [Rufibacter glacialis]GGK63926.1 hypothetical protein GCM10011405_09910 [Rufibacter glacialis]
MGKTILLIEPYMSIWVDTKTNILYVDWWGAITKENVLDGCRLLLSMLEKETCNMIINNNANVTSHWKATAIWAATIGFLELDKTTCAYFAWVKPPQSNLSSDYVARLDTRKVQVKIFDSQLAAERWLLSVQQNLPQKEEAVEEAA